MKLVWCLLLLPSCWLVSIKAASESEAGTTSDPCAISLESLNDVFRELISEGLDLYVNCLSFDEFGSLTSGIVSGVNRTDNGPGERFNVSCVRGVIVTRESIHNSTTSLPENNTACLTCNDSSDDNICVNVCESPCERCYEDTRNCTRCIACTDDEADHCYPSRARNVSLMCAASCNSERNLIPKRELFNFCDCPTGYFKQLIEYPEAVEKKGEEEKTECDYDPKLEEFRCVEECQGGFLFNKELQRCFACRLDYCVSCNGVVSENENSTEDDSESECNVCLEETRIYEHRCFACPKAIVVHNAVEQDHELEEEERDQYLRQIELAVSLPILCVLVIIFFLAMSWFAHLRYPHVNPQGHKRHRTKPEDYESPIVASAEDSNSDLEPASADVWRARPTIRLR